jgi:hypothetical protein
MHPLEMLQQWFARQGVRPDDIDVEAFDVTRYQVTREPITVPEPTINVVPWKQGLCFQAVWGGCLVEWLVLN